MASSSPLPKRSPLPPLLLLAVVALALLAAAGLLFRQQFLALEDITHQRNDQVRSISLLQSLDADLGDAENGLRSYVLTHDAAFLRSYTLNTREAHEDLRGLGDSLTPRSPEYVECGAIESALLTWEQAIARPRLAPNAHAAGLAQLSLMPLRNRAGALLAAEREKRRVLSQAAIRISEDGKRTAWLLAVTALGMFVLVIALCVRLKITRLREQRNQLGRLAAIGEVLVRETDLNRLAETTLSTMLDGFSLEMGGIFLYRESDATLEMIACQGCPEMLAREIAHQPVTPDSPWAAAQSAYRRTMVSAASLSRQPGNEPLTAKFGTIGLGDIVSVPMLVGDRLIGVFSIARGGKRPFTPAECETIQLIARQTATALDNARSLRALQQLNQLKSDFITSVSHELRTPLTAIKGAASLLEAGEVPLSGQQHQFLGMIRANTERLAGLIQDLLDLSRLESGDMRYSRDFICLEQLAEEALGAVAAAAEARGVHLTLSVPAAVPAVYADREKLAQVFAHLLDNGLKFTPTGGSVSLDVTAAEGGVRVRVTDTGIGISREDRSRLFQKFNKLDLTLTRRTGGTGLGLAICREIIEAHGGRIALDSEPGRGSSFYFTLPAAGLTSAEAAEREAS